MVPKTTVLSSENLKLRIPNPADMEYIFSATRFEGFNDGMPWGPPESMADLVKPYERSIQAWEARKEYSFTIEQKVTSEFLGRISIRVTEEDGVWDIGFWTHPQHQGKGVMTEAVKVILAFGFEKLKAKKIEACYAIWNKASEKVLQKNGMTFIQLIEKGFQKNGKWVAENQVAITLEKWETSLMS